MPIQKERSTAVQSPLGEDVLLLDRMSGQEELSRLFRFDLDLLSEKPDVKVKDILGQPVTVRVGYSSEKPRFFHGLVSEFRMVGREGSYVRYQAALRPWLWFLTRTADCRIFPDKSKAKTATAPDIIKAVFKEHNFTDFEDLLKETYKPWEHCVQYRETDFNFVSRLMEQEGIYYYFKHEENKHTMVLADAYGSHEATADYEVVPFFPPENLQRKRDHLYDWSFEAEVQPGVFALNDFDFELPKANQEVKSSFQRENAQAKFEVYDYPGEYVEPADGKLEDKVGNQGLKEAYEKFARNRIEELQVRYMVAHGSGNARGLAAGALFTLSEHPREDQNCEYLITSVRHEVRAEPLDSRQAAANPALYTCQISAIDAKQPFRAPRVTPKPAIQGPQTAIVVGPSGETVHTDSYGRVRVQFHWDRYGKSDENSSCWVRVSQNWAGSTWGGMFIPHVGQEVIVEFLEGDPDRPIITGRVYNADNMPPLELPGNKYKSVIRDHFGNEMEFDGTPGEEHLTLYSPSHSSMLQLGKSEKKITKSEAFEMAYGNKESVTIGNQSTWTKGNSTSVTVGQSLSHKRGGSFSLDIGASATAFVGLKADVFIGASISLMASFSIAFGLSREWRYTKGQYARSSGDMIVLDSKKDIVACGGKDDHTMLRSNDTFIQMVWGKGDPDRNMSAVDNTQVLLAAISAVILGGAGVAAGHLSWTAAEVEQVVKVAPPGDASGNKIAEEDIERAKDFTSADAAVAGFLGAGMALLVGAAWSKDIKPPQHDTETAKVKVSDKEVNISAGDGPETSLVLNGADKKVTIIGDELVKIMAKNVHIMAKNVHITADSKILLDAPLVEATTKIKQPDFTAGS